jgi:hypothetical protein
VSPFCTIIVQVGPPVRLGNDGFGEARVVPILGGSVSGPGLVGKVLAGGSDEQRIRADGLTRIHARYVIEAEDGALIRVDNQGLRHGPPEVMAAALRGEPVDATQIWFRSVFRFETAALAHDELNKGIFIAKGERRPEGVVLTLERIT